MHACKQTRTLRRASSQRVFVQVKGRMCTVCACSPAARTRLKCQSICLERARHCHCCVCAWCLPHCRGPPAHVAPSQAAAQGAPWPQEKVRFPVLALNVCGSAGQDTAYALHEHHSRAAYSSFTQLAFNFSRHLLCFLEPLETLLFQQCSGNDPLS